MALAVHFAPMTKGVNQFMAELRAFIKSCDSQSDAAGKLKITPQFLCDIMSKRRPVPPKIAAQFGYEWDLLKRAFR
jgi:hypothetical protein